ncbi:uncharacterized protein EI90DRAFT_1019844 [Cantharellus anzutake]|uniref:uncharacterized protein n=1 Tax=Cantharellus anzutake TaxID=1750568 RepID=UPI00190533C1|nr:uncharacterized protein EI90DRAFT_1019844 [Cantharellus anzutake]KAF8331421.1 hypothetical protein EI90DRAFT_1019844 [Cantharellus anzutake]
MREASFLRSCAVDTSTVSRKSPIAIFLAVRKRSPPSRAPSPWPINVEHFKCHHRSQAAQDEQAGFEASFSVVYVYGEAPSRGQSITDTLPVPTQGPTHKPAAKRAQNPTSKRGTRQVVAFHRAESQQPSKAAAGSQKETIMGAVIFQTECHRQR